MKLIYGVGYNDSHTPIAKTEKGADGKRKMVWRCPYYVRWCDMLNRCYSHKRIKSYSETIVCEEWLTFSNFRDWMKQQEDILGSLVDMHLDKDLFSDEVKVYSPSTCCFLHKKVNCFLTRSEDTPNKCIRFKGKSWIVECSTTFSNKMHYEGGFTCQESALTAYKAYKESLVRRLQEEGYIKEERVLDRLLVKYATL